MYMYIPHRWLQEHVCLDRTLAIGDAKEDSKPQEFQEFQEFQVLPELSVVDFPPEQQGKLLGSTLSMDSLTRSFESAIRGNLDHANIIPISYLVACVHYESIMSLVSIEAITWLIKI